MRLHEGPAACWETNSCLRNEVDEAGQISMFPRYLAWHLFAADGNCILEESAELSLCVPLGP